MKIEVYTLEFSYFSGASWDMVDVTITATSLYQLMKTYLYETSDLHEVMGKLTQKELIKSKWESVKKFIRKEKLEFPLVDRKSWH